MDIRETEDLIFKYFPYEPTDGQRIMILALTEFVLNRSSKEVFIFKGYAGTGKTTVLSALIKAAATVGINTVLMAPTGRAAKVLASYSGKQATTIHKKIFQPRTTGDGSVYLHRIRNVYKNTLFIVDEASMIPAASQPPEGQFFSESDLLTDLIGYVYSGENCTLILIGDPAQLPPVGAELSPALDSGYLKTTYSLSVRSLELTEVMRQSYDSGILANATLIRQKIEKEDIRFPLFLSKDFPDVTRIQGQFLEDTLNSAISSRLYESVVVITASNKRANIYNSEIRKRILFREEEISAGDIMMVVKNNYYWLPADTAAGFIANGDMIEILKVKRISDIYGFRFADVVIRMIDYQDQPELEVKIILNTIYTEHAALSFPENRQLFDEIEKDYDDIPERRKRLEKIKNNPWFNALQVKFAYAMTCHKTQGGQWDIVFIDQPFLPENKISRDFLRWLYTALTRATSKIYLINFKEMFFGSDDGKQSFG